MSEDNVSMTPEAMTPEETTPELATLAIAPSEATAAEVTTVAATASEGTAVEVAAPAVTAQEAPVAEVIASAVTTPEQPVAEVMTTALMIPEATTAEAISSEVVAREAAVPEVAAPALTSAEATTAEAAPTCEVPAPEASTPEATTPEVAVEAVAPVESNIEIKAEAKLEEIKVGKEESKVAGRPFRVKLRGSVLVLVRLPNRRDVRAAIHQLSVTGGVIHLEKPLDEKIVVEVIFHLGKTTIREKAQMLFPMWATQGWMQPFRFMDLTDANREGLDASLKAFISGAASAPQATKGAAAGR